MTDSGLKNKSKPVDDIEDEEKDWERDQEELVNPEIKVDNYDYDDNYVMLYICQMPDVICQMPEFSCYLSNV